ncbi:ABC transporter substrate-binding protein [Anaerosinus massiliensis]|uniref:ABC transporter substrate-binding protein n=1 Tax=Massilibacillus massiliensis TaxID=1806837 RepID=UPI0018FEB34E|nr:ABC transporter substrate-binding protein [Massilibacillus massiliensis]
MLGYDRLVQDIWHESHEDLCPVRCVFCNSLLFRGIVEKVEIKCPKCGTIQLLNHKGDSRIQKRNSPRRQLDKSGDIQNRMVTDSAGRLVEIPSHPRRVVILNSSNLGLYVATGGMPIGRGTSDRLPAILEDKVKDIPEVGIPENPDLKRIVEMKPDLVIGMAFPTYRSLAAVLERKGIPTILQTFSNYASVLEGLCFYGELNGTEKIAEKKIGVIEKHRQQLIEQIGEQPSPRVLVVWSIDGELYAALSTSFVGDMVKRLGGVNVFDLITIKDEKLAYAPLDFETITEIQIDVILFVDHHLSGGENQKNTSLLHSPWQKLNTLQKNRRIYKLPYSLFAVNPGIQMEKALSVLAAFLYEK